MRHLTMLTIGVLALSNWMATTTLQAGSPHFIGTPTASLDKFGDYVVSFKEAGLGNTPITFSLTATTASFTFQCFTKSNNTPEGAPNGISFSNEKTFVTLTPRNGQITGSVSLMPETGGASCQGGGLDLFLIAVDYEGVTFCDVTDNVCVSTGNQSATGLHVDIDQ